MEALPKLEIDPQKIWDQIERNFGRNYFDSVVVKLYGNLFEDRDEQTFLKDLRNVREEIKQQVQDVTQNYEDIIRQMKSEMSSKIMEMYDLKDKYMLAVETTQLECDVAVRHLLQEQQSQLLKRMEQERLGLLEEMEEQEKEYAYFDQILAKEKFRNFLFRWKILIKVNKMKKMDRDSYEFTKASLEVQELVKRDMDLRIEIETSKLRKLYDQQKDKY